MKELEEKIINEEGTFLFLGMVLPALAPIFEKNSKIKETYYINASTKGEKEGFGSHDVAKNVALKDIHKYFKDGVDNFYCEFSEVKKYVPAFIRESLRITKNNIYICFNNKKDYQKIKNKYDRYQIASTLFIVDNKYIGLFYANDILIPFFKELKFYFHDTLEKWYEYINENF